MPESLNGIAYTASATTSSSSRAVLQMLEREALDQGLEVRDRAPSYLNLASKRAVPGGVSAAIAAGILILLADLALTAVTPLFIVLLPVALLPALPFAIGRGNSVTVAAFEAGETTLVTADGRSSKMVGRVIDDFIATLVGSSGASGAAVPAKPGARKSQTKKRTSEPTSVDEPDHGDDDTL